MKNEPGSCPLNVLSNEIFSSYCRLPTPSSSLCVRAAWILVIGSHVDMEAGISSSKDPMSFWQDVVDSAGRGGGKNGHSRCEVTVALGEPGEPVVGWSAPGRIEVDYDKKVTGLVSFRNVVRCQESGDDGIG